MPFIDILPLRLGHRPVGRRVDSPALRAMSVLPGELRRGGATLLACAVSLGNATDARGCSLHASGVAGGARSIGSAENAARDVAVRFAILEAGGKRIPWRHAPVRAHLHGPRLENLC